MRNRVWPWCAEFGLGAAMGSLLDRIHIRFRIISYDNTSPRLTWMGQPMWVPPLFGSSAVVFGAISRLFPDVYQSATHIVVRSGMGSNAAWFLVAYCFSAVKALRSLERAVLMCLSMALRLRQQPTSLKLYCVACAAVGCLVESVLIAGKFFRHTETDLWQLPAWLPFLYMHAAPFIRNLHSFIHPLTQN